MPTPKNGFQILNLHPKKRVFKKMPFLMYFCLSYTAHPFKVKELIHLYYILGFWLCFCLSPVKNRRSPITKLMGRHNCFKSLCEAQASLTLSATVVTTLDNHPKFRPSWIVESSTNFLYLRWSSICVETCVKCSDKSDKKWRSYSLCKMSIVYPL